MGGCCGKRRENEKRSKGEINRLLPAEVLEQVFMLLSTKDLMNAVQVKIINFLSTIAIIMSKGSIKQMANMTVIASRCVGGGGRLAKRPFFGLGFVFPL